MIIMDKKKHDRIFGNITNIVIASCPYRHHWYPCNKGVGRNR